MIVYVLVHESLTLHTCAALRDTLTRAVESHFSLFRGVTLELNFDDGMPDVIWLDPMRVHQVRWRIA
jgi:hypothetical protein